MTIRLDHFCYAFKKRYGVSPNQYRRSGGRARDIRCP
ncbi:MAG: AraC family transcriptional regulator [Synergistaceae bacterium]|nr:AraC family transcriptional regulator [Synergistaceae bacterium]